MWRVTRGRQAAGALKQAQGLQEGSSEGREGMCGGDHRTRGERGCWFRYQRGRAADAVLVNSVNYVKLRSGGGSRIEANTDKVAVDGSYSLGRNYIYS